MRDLTIFAVFGGRERRGRMGLLRFDQSGFFEGRKFFSYVILCWFLFFSVPSEVEHAGEQGQERRKGRKGPEADRRGRVTAQAHRFFFKRFAVTVAVFAHVFTFQRFYRTVHEIGGGPFLWFDLV